MKVNSLFILFLLVGALCAAFFFLGKQSVKTPEPRVDTLYVTRSDTTFITVEKTATIIDTVIVKDSVSIPSYIATIDTTLVNPDSASVRLNISFYDYEKKFVIKGLFRSVSQTIYLKECIESPEKHSWLYGDISAFKYKNKPDLKIGCGINLKNDYYMGIELGYQLYGIKVGRRF